jgi:hypothetical protein
MPTPSLILVPARFKTGKLYTPLATTSGGLVLGASGDFNVTRATTATRFNSAGLIESVASGVPRLDYYTSGGTAGCPALLVEPSAANGILNSNNTATSWSRGSSLTSGYTDVIGVSGNNLTVAVSGSNIGTGAGRLQSTTNNVSLASGSTYTISFLMKKTGTHTIGGYYAVIGGADIASGFDVSGSFSSGSIYNSAPTTNRIRRVEQWGTDVYRCSETFTMTSGTTLTFLNFAPLSGVTNANNPVSGSQIAFAAPQIELGSVPTTFIPTTTAAVTRNADAISVTGAVSGCIGQSEGTVYVEVDYRNVANITMLSVQTASIVSGVVRIETNGNELRCHVRDVSGTIRMDQIITSPTLSTGINKIAVGYSSAASGLCIALNGTVVFTATTAAAFTINPDRILLGSREVSSASQLFFNNRIRAAAIYTTRLTNAELAALTTL